MNNSNVESILNSCWVDIEQVKIIIDGLGISSNIHPYLTKYAIVRACGAIETAYKAVVADYCCRRSKLEVKNYINTFIRQRSSNPSYDRIISTLRHFNPTWADDFQNAIRSHPDSTLLSTSLQSLVDARNDFAHGGSPSITINALRDHYQYSCEIINLLDQIVY